MRYFKKEMAKIKNFEKDELDFNRKYAIKINDITSKLDMAANQPHCHKPKKKARLQQS